jgi:hypothetical protein
VEGYLSVEFVEVVVIVVIVVMVVSPLSPDTAVRIFDLIPYDLCLTAGRQALSLSSPFLRKFIQKHLI